MIIGGGGGGCVHTLKAWALAMRVALIVVKCLCTSFACNNSNQGKMVHKREWAFRIKKAVFSRNFRHS